MNKTVVLGAIAIVAGLASCGSHVAQYVETMVQAPFEMPLIKEFIYPDKTFSIADYGAVADTATINTEAIAKAIAACNKAGGGLVVVPEGEWLTGPVHLMSNVNLHLSEGAVVRFIDDPKAYLPAVHTSWEGMECYNYSPLVYAYDCENVAITGTGMLAPMMGHWRTWFKRSEAQTEAQKQLYHMASTDVPVEQRQMAVGENNLRPHLIQFNRCRNIKLEDFKIRESPFWTIHMYMCDGGIARRLDVYAHGFNNDGIDLEMTRNFLVEDCIFDQGDDAVVIKSGRNQDAWRLATPTENIVVRNCNIRAGHTLLGIGSEISGGVKNVYMHNCEAPITVFRLFFVKTNHRRGGELCNIYMDSVKAGGAISVLDINTDVLYQWRNSVPTYADSLTLIDGMYLSNIEMNEAKNIYSIKGDPRKPIGRVSLRNVHVGAVEDTTLLALNVHSLVTENITYDSICTGILPQLTSHMNDK